MDILTLIGIALGLSMDAFAVAIASGCATQNLKFHQALRMAIFFGAFQAIMPILGWLAGFSFRNYISAFDHWIAFGLLLIIGGKMIVEFFKMKEEEEKKSCAMDVPNLFILAIATSIDALAVGLTLSFLKTAIIYPAIVIGCITFAFSLAGVFLGKKFGHLVENKMELVGGLILVGIGVKILVEHTIFK